MSEAKKPEWFEIVESDQPIQRNHRGRASTLRPLVALAATGVIIGAGAVIANAGDDNQATIQSEITSTAIAPAALRASSPNTSAINAARGEKISVASRVVGTPSNTRDAIQNPMTQGGRGEDDDFHEERDGHHDEERESHHRGQRGHHDEEHEDFERDDD